MYFLPWEDCLSLASPEPTSSMPFIWRAPLWNKMQKLKNHKSPSFSGISLRTATSTLEMEHFFLTAQRLCDMSLIPRQNHSQWKSNIHVHHPGQSILSYPIFSGEKYPCFENTSKKGSPVMAKPWPRPPWEEVQVHEWSKARSSFRITSNRCAPRCFFSFSHAWAVFELEKTFQF